MSYYNPKTINFVKENFTDQENRPFILTSGQNEIFDIIAQRKYPRTQAITYTQYGKSVTCALGALARVTNFPESWAIVAPTNKKAHIIMGYIIDHIFDNPGIKAQFRISADESLERIRRERRKDKLTFNLGGNEIGSVFTLTTEGKRVKDVLDAIMGFGAKSVLLDESSLISDPQYAGVKRMLGGHKDNFLFEIGNPFRRNHFYRTYRDPLYYHINIDYRQGIEEGRISEEFINEMRKEAFFSILYECKFPEEEEIDERGYMPLVTEKMLDRAYADELTFFGEPCLGVDVSAGGSNKSVIIVRANNGAKIVFTQRTSDTMTLVGQILKAMKEYDVKASNIFVDAIGVGKGVLDRLREVKEVGEDIPEIKWGEKPEDRDDNFMNSKAQAYWRLSEWLNMGGRLLRDSDWEELLDIKYKVQSDRKIKIKGKIEMAKEGVASPDTADALAMTFVRVVVPNRYTTILPKHYYRG